MQIFYRFSEQLTDASDGSKTLLGGKGAGLVNMTKLGLPVPPGFTIPTQVCREYQIASIDVMKMIGEGLIDPMLWLEDQMGYMPLVSVRSGAPVSMPGMMDTILNVGISLDNIDEWAERIGERSAWDSYRRFLQMFGATVYDIPAKEFEAKLDAVKKKAKAGADSDLKLEHLQEVVGSYIEVYEQFGMLVPQDPLQQVLLSIEAVFKSWNSERAIVYRKAHGISDALGTAVTVQSMVFGNMNDKSGSGVMFTRCPNSGAKKLIGEFLPNAQGEEVVAGTRTPMKIGAMMQASQPWPKILGQLRALAEKLEAKLNDVQDIEFTVQDGKLFVLQTRSAKRTAQAALKIVRAFVEEGRVEKKDALARLTKKDFANALLPMIDPATAPTPIATGLPACSGIVTGRVVFSAEDAVKAKEPVILVTHETSPDDIAGMIAAIGVLTQTGGATSHAAVVARSLNKVCVVGAGKIGMLGHEAEVMLTTNDVISIDGTTGHVYKGAVKVLQPAGEEEFAPFFDMLDWQAGTVRRVRIAGAFPAMMYASDLDDRDEDGMLASLNSLTWVPEAYRAQTILSFLPPSGESALTEAEAKLLLAAGAEPMAPRWQWEIVKTLEQLAPQLKGMTVLVDPKSEIAAKLGKAGYAIGGVVTSIKDMLACTSQYAVITPDFKNAVGGATVLKDLLAVFEKAGRKIAAVPKAQTPMQRLFEVLGG